MDEQDQGSAPAETTVDQTTQTSPAGVGQPEGTPPPVPDAAPDQPEAPADVVEAEQPPADAPAPADAEAPAEGAAEGTLGRPATEYDHTAPAGAVWPNADAGGAPRQHGEGDDALGVAPSAFPDAGAPIETSGITEPDQVEIDRPDIGTPVGDEKPEGSVEANNESENA